MLAIDKYALNGVSYIDTFRKRKAHEETYGQAHGNHEPAKI